MAKTKTTKVKKVKKSVNELAKGWKRVSKSIVSVPDKKVSKSKEGKYTLAVKVDDVNYMGSADSMVSALTDFVASKNYPLGAKTMAVFNVRKGEKIYSEIWRVARCRKMFNLMSLKPTAIEIVAGKLEAALT